VLQKKPRPEPDELDERLDDPEDSADEPLGRAVELGLLELPDDAVEE
jgi:hypothetical protein